MANKENQDSLTNYRFIKTIGEGTFGKVKLSIHLPTNEYVAIKILEKSKITDKDELERVEKEIKYLKLFNHPNIIQIYEVIETEQNFYIVTEYVPGGELFNYIVKKERLEEKEASFFYSQIIHGINEISQKKICHRDIKPENLLLTNDKIIKIIDFGLSNEYIDTLNTQCGSPCYAAPEIILGNKYNGLNVDIWASGIILFAMIYGYLPFDDKDNNILFRKILECKLEFPQDLYASDEVKDLISRILVFNPNKRINLEEILKHPFLTEGNKQYNNIVKLPKFKHEKIIINYMTYILKYSNDYNSISNLVKSNKHDSITTTYKLLKKQIIEKRFNYDLYIEKMRHMFPYISPIKNIHVKSNNFNINSPRKNNKKKIFLENNKTNIHNINLLSNRTKEKVNLRRCLIENNKTNKENKPLSTERKQISNKINDLSIDKKKKLNNNDIFDFGRFNTNNLIKKNLRMYPLFCKLLLKNNRNLFIKMIDTSVSVDKKNLKKKYKKINKSKRSSTKDRTCKSNPFRHKNDPSQKNIKKRNLRFIQFLSPRTNRDKSDNKIYKNLNINKYIQTPISLKVYLNNYIKIKNKYTLSPINKCSTLSYDKSKNMRNHHHKDKIKIKKYLFPIDNGKKCKNNICILNKNIKSIENENRVKSPNFKNEIIIEKNNKYSLKNNIIKNSQKNCILKNGINTPEFHNYNTYKYNTIQTTPNSFRNDNSLNNINTKVICQMNNMNKKNCDNKKREIKNINKSKKVNIKICNKNYNPLNKRDIRELTELKDLEKICLTAPNISNIYHMNYTAKKRPEIRTIYIGNKNINPRIYNHQKSNK